MTKVAKPGHRLLGGEWAPDVDVFETPGSRVYSALLRAFEHAEDGVKLDFISALAARDSYLTLHRGAKKVVDQIAREVGLA